MHALKALAVLLLFSAVRAEKSKVCSLQQPSNNDCQQLERSEITCTYNLHGVDCINNIRYGLADFGRVTPEEALIAANLVDNIVVIGEQRTEARREESAPYSTAVLVKADHVNGMGGLRGKKYCHPGFDFLEPMTELILKEFERTVLQINNAYDCKAKIDTLFEKELKSLSDFFGPSCRLGPWIDLENLNKDYQKKYSKLCEFCNGNCNVQAGSSPFMQSLECLVNNDGDVALTALDTVNAFFNKSENTNRKNDFMYLCRNNTLSPLDKPCVWSSQPWDLIIAHREKAEDIKTKLESWMPRSIIQLDAGAPYNLNSGAEEYLKAVLFSNPQTQQFKLNNVQSLKDYIKEYRVIPTITESELCNQDIKWCTVSNAEQEKCLWLAQASINHGIQPVLKCVKSLGHVGCLEDIKNNRADVVTSDAHLAYIARKKNLAALAYSETSENNRISPIVIIKSTETNINRFENLKGKKACFPEYGGIEWMSFINTARDRGVLSKTTCDYGELISEFVGESCMPGARDKEHETSENLDENKLCDLCLPNHFLSKTHTTCNSDEANLYYGNLGALECLKKSGDFAVITKGDYKDINSKEFKVLCKNGSLAASEGFDVDSNCALSTTIDSEVVSKRDNPKNGDIKMLLLNFEKRFGTDRVKAFEVFNIFNNTKDLLFMDSTLGLDSVNSENEYIQNYKDLLAHIDKCTASNKNSASGIYSKWIAVTCLLSYFMTK